MSSAQQLLGIAPNKLRECLHSIFPPIMPELLREAANPEPDFDNIARIISLDPALTTVVLALVNSAYYGLNQKVTDLKRAAVVLGNREIFKLAFSITLIQNTNVALGSAQTDFYASWRLMLWSAIAAELIAEHTSPQDTEGAYLCALLKDISLIVAAAVRPDILKETDTPLLAANNAAETNMQDHPRATIDLLKEWNFPSDFFPPIRHHHDLDGLEQLPALDQAVILGTRWAEIEMDPHVPPAPLVQFKLLLHRVLHLDETSIEQLRNQCIQRFRSMAGSLNITEAPLDARLYEHSLHSIQLYYFQNIDLTQARGGLPGVARTVFRHLSWNWDISDCELALRLPDSGSWTLFTLSSQTQQQSEEKFSRFELPWKNSRTGFMLKASGHELGELRLFDKPPEVQRAEIELYLWFAGQSFEHYSLRQAVLENRAQALDLLPVGVASLDPHGKVLDYNSRMLRHLEVSGTLKGLDFWNALARSKGLELDREWEQFLKHPDHKSFSKIVCPLGPEGTKNPICLYIAAYASTTGNTRRILVMVEDIAEVTDLQIKALQQRDFLARLMHSMEEVVMVVDGGGTILFASPRLAEQLEHKNLFMVTQPTDVFTGHWDPSVLRESQAPFEINLPLSDDQKPLPLEISITPLNEQPRSYLVVGRDLSRIHRLENKLKRQAIYDHLTGVFNRHQFQMFLEREAARARRRNESLGLLFMDIDNFKMLNDLEGHQAGDLALQSIGKALRSQVRRGMDYPCRFGGDEFTVLATNVDQREIKTLAERIRLACREKLPGSLSISMGLALLKKGEDIAEFLRRADQACFKAKSSGGDRLKWSEEDAKNGTSSEEP